ncbi:MAG: enoyl-CoA hydratase-related protein [Acidimicrobiia bacterium]
MGVQGNCLGGGLELVLGCGIVIAEESAKLGCPEIQLGVLPPAATALLGAQGKSRLAEDILLTGRTLRTDEAKAVGIVNAVAPDGELDATIDAYVGQHFLARSASSLRIATAAIRESYAADVDARLAAAERAYLEELLPTHDGVEGIQAFIDKRSPAWSDK